ncbi:MAG: MFS transporter, partial [Myxococcales bacterium]
PRLGLLWLVFFFNTFAFAAFEPTFALFANWRFSFDEGSVGYLFAFVGVVLAVMQGGVVGRLSKRFGEEPLVFAGILLLALSLALLPHVPSPTVLLLDLGLLAAGNALLGPSTSSLISKASPFDYGIVLGVSQGLGSLARASGPALGGKLYDLSPDGHTAPFHFAAGVLVMTFGLAVFGLRRFRVAAEPAANLNPPTQPST